MSSVCMLSSSLIIVINSTTKVQLKYNRIVITSNVDVVCKEVVVQFVFEGSSRSIVV